jgi:hypothetical protein
MQLLSVETKYRIINFAVKWVLATCLGFLSSLLIIEVGENPDLGVMEAAIGSLAIALPQSYLLRKAIDPVKWVLSTLCAWVIMATMGVGVLGWTVTTVNFLPTRVFTGIIIGGIGGLLIGISQWWFAIPPLFPSSWKWVFVNTTSWMIATPIGSTIGLFLHKTTNLFLGEVVGLAITWLLVAIVTGIFAVKIIKDL